MSVISLHEPHGVLEHLTGYLKKALAITQMEMQKLLHDQWDIFTRSVQPVLWLLLFGGVFGRLRILPPELSQYSYLDFVTPGVLAQSVMTISILQGISLIWERDQGTLQKYLVSPMPRSALVLGKGIGAGVRGTIQALTISILALIMGVHLTWNPLAWLGVVAFIFLGAVFFSTLSLLISALVRTRERVQGLGQLIMMPAFFASNALYPVTIMPPYVEALARFNPLSYMVDGLRELMVGIPGHFGLGVNLTVLVVVNAVMIWLASRVFPRVVY